jgi:tetratricopeptide (TPR) repeat protein
MEHLRSLYIQLKFDEVIQFATITLQISLQKKRHKEALGCYEFLASAFHEKGDFEAFINIMPEYEKLTVTFGNDENKLIYYYLMSLLNKLVKNYEDANDHAKKSIRYAYLLKNEEMVAINFATIATLQIYMGNMEKAEMAERFAQYYKDRLPTRNLSMVRGNVGLLHYYAMTADDTSFNHIKNEMLETATNDIALNYQGQIDLAEAILLDKLGDDKQSLMYMNKAYSYYKERKNLVYLKTIYHYVTSHGQEKQASFYDELAQILETCQFHFPITGVEDIKGLQNDLFLHEASHPATFKYKNIVSKDEMEKYVQQAIANNQPVICLHWAFMTEDIEGLFGELFEQQLLFSLFETVINFTSVYCAEILIRSNNEGEAIFTDLSEDIFLDLLQQLEQKLQEIFLQSTTGPITVPVYFGYTSTNQLSLDQRSYEELVAHADVNLYYAKSKI